MDDLFNDSDDLNEIQKEFIDKLEAQFCERFSEKDDEFMKVHKNEELVPPIMDPWERSFGDRRNRKRRRDNDFNSRDNYGPRRRFNDDRYNRSDDRRFDHHDNHDNRRHDRYDNHHRNRYYR